MDLAVAHPEVVEGLVLMDSGGHSYAQPPPALTATAQWGWLVGGGAPRAARGGRAAPEAAGQMRRWSTPKPKPREGDSGIMVTTNL